MKYIVQISRVIVGLLFIVSGFVKIIDPVGMGYKLEEYFSPTVLNLPFLMDFNLPIAVFLTLLEVMLGILLLLGVLRKFTTYTLLLTIIFFTFLTFYSAYFNKVTDCGCFGDALKLEPWTSFYKDVILLVLIIILVIGQKYIRPILPQKINLIVLILTFIASIYVAYQGINHSPIIDFRAYAVGKDIKKGMMSAEELGLKPSQYRTFYTLKNKQTGEIISIDDKAYVADDKWYKAGTPWEIQSDLTENKMVFKGYEPPVKDFYLDCNGEDKAEFYLNASKVIFVVFPFADRIEAEKVSKINDFIAEAKTKKLTVAILANNQVEGITEPICIVDQIALKTMTRSNPGILKIEKGVVTAKFHYNDFPTIETL